MREFRMMLWTSASFPFGISLFLATDGSALTQVSFAASADDTPADWLEDGVRSPENPILADAIGQLREYFAGSRETFSVPLRPAGTPFQLSVWRALEEIPYGHTRTYRDIACMLGRPTATRAVGAANGQNPLPIFVPCHRVIGSNGSLTGFGGGLDVKLALLRLEGVLLPG
jgi:methylated-DNA-[protein]-cysteine S-methyltransferase